MHGERIPRPGFLGQQMVDRGNGGRHQRGLGVNEVEGGILGAKFKAKPPWKRAVLILPVWRLYFR
ncbi:hypothetical protein LP419_15815 [Massilia sp. H-1]|nr:hypothetical protein LP419_15815 [Massilia sp. H-1]